MNKIIVQLLHQPFWCKTYDSISIQYENVIESVCARMMDNNLKQEIILSGLLNLGTIDSPLGSLQNISASYDMTWTKRGYHSPQVNTHHLFICLQCVLITLPGSWKVDWVADWSRCRFWCLSKDLLAVQRLQAKGSAFRSITSAFLQAESRRFLGIHGNCIGCENASRSFRERGSPQCGRRRLWHSCYLTSQRSGDAKVGKRSEMSWTEPFV